VRPSSRRASRYLAAALAAAAASLIIVPALADKPPTALDRRAAEVAWIARIVRAKQ